MSGVIRPAMRASSSSKAGRARASAAENFSTSRWVAARSSSRRSEEPSGPRFSAGPGGIDRDPALDQAKVPPDRLAQHAEDVGAGRGVKARGELLGHRAPADDLAALEDNRLEARAREVVGRDETVVAAADDRDIPGLGPRGAHDSSCLIFVRR